MYSLRLRKSMEFQTRACNAVGTHWEARVRRTPRPRPWRTWWYFPGAGGSGGPSLHTTHTRPWYYSVPRSSRSSAILLVGFETTPANKRDFYHSKITTTTSTTTTTIKLNVSLLRATTTIIAIFVVNNNFTTICNLRSCNFVVVFVIVIAVVFFFFIVVVVVVLMTVVVGSVKFMLTTN